MDTAAASPTWTDFGPIPGIVINSQPILIPGTPAVLAPGTATVITPAIPTKILVPIQTSSATTAAALLFNFATNPGTWEPVVASSPIMLNGACAVNFKPGKQKSYLHAK